MLAIVHNIILTQKLYAYLKYDIINKRKKYVINLNYIKMLDAPPSIGSMVPVMNVDSSDARNNA